MSPQTQTPIWKVPPPLPSITGTIPRSRDTHYLWASPRGGGATWRGESASVANFSPSMSKFCTRGSERGEGWKKKNISNRSALLLKMAAIVASLGRGSRGNSLQGSTSASVLWPLAGSSPSFVEHRILLMTDKILCLLVEIQLLLRAYLEMGTQLKRKLNFLNWKTILASGITGIKLV